MNFTVLRVRGEKKKLHQFLKYFKNWCNFWRKKKKKRRPSRPLLRRVQPKWASATLDSSVHRFFCTDWVTFSKFIALNRPTRLLPHLPKIFPPHLEKIFTMRALNRSTWWGPLLEARVKGIAKQLFLSGIIYVYISWTKGLHPSVVYDPDLQADAAM